MLANLGRLLLRGGLRVLSAAKVLFAVDLPAPRRPRMRTASVCATSTARGTHSFKIAGYSLHRGLGAGRSVCSANFAGGGRDWCILYYPDGNIGEDYKGYVAVFLELMSEPIEVRMLFDFKLVNPVTGLSSPCSSMITSPAVFNGVNPMWGNIRFMKKSELESSAYLRDDSLVIECHFTVIKESQVEETDITSNFHIQVPPSDLTDDLKKLLESKDGADVSFKVEGETFHAHKIVLAMRSPVFKAQLCGPMREKGMKSIIIEGMQPAVFEVLLHFIYTDMFPVLDDLDRDEEEEMVKYLLVASDTSAMERMKLMCEHILCKRLGARLDQRKLKGIYF